MLTGWSYTILKVFKLKYDQQYCKVPFLQFVYWLIQLCHKYRGVEADREPYQSVFKHNICHEIQYSKQIESFGSIPCLFVVCGNLRLRIDYNQQEQSLAQYSITVMIAINSQQQKNKEKLMFRQNNLLLQNNKI